MKALSLLLLTVLILGAGCNQRPSPPPPPPAPLLPPADGPVVWRYSPTDGYIEFWMKPETVGMRMSNYIEALDGSWRMQWYGINPGNTQENPGGRMVESLYNREAYMVHYAQDFVWDYDTGCKCSYLKYGGRKFYWKYRFRLNTDVTPWRFEYPIGPVTFEILDKFPWEEAGYEADPWPNTYIWNFLTTGPMAAQPFMGCLQADVPDFSNAKRGIFLSSWFPAAVQWGEVPVNGNGPVSYTRKWLWIDNEFDTMFGSGVTSGIYITHATQVNPRFLALSNRHHEVVLLAYADGLGPLTKPWEKRWWRLAGRGAGGFENPDGSVRCDYGEWRLDEITNAAAIAWMDSWRTSSRRMPPDGPMTPQQRAWLWPAGW